MIIQISNFKLARRQAGFQFPIFLTSGGFPHLKTKILHINYVKLQINKQQVIIKFVVEPICFLTFVSPRDIQFWHDRCLLIFA